MTLIPPSLCYFCIKLASLDIQNSEIAGMLDKALMEILIPSASSYCKNKTNPIRGPSLQNFQTMCYDKFGISPLLNA